MLYIRFFLCIAQSEAVSKEQIALLAYVIIAMLLFSALFILFFITFQKRKNEMLLKEIEQKRQFDEELVTTQQEIQDETLKHVGRELHDNVGQLLSVAKMQMNSVVRNVDDSLKSRAEGAIAALNDSLDEVRALSKSLNSDVIFNMGFDKTVQNEINRLNKMGRLQANIVIDGEKVNFENKKDEVILFRILQEFFSNTIKYADAEKLDVSIQYNPEILEITVKDDGTGFDMSTAEKGSGLINMEKRAELINTEFLLESELEKGTTLNLKYPYKAM